MTINILVVQEHYSEGRAGLHWDFRLQAGNTLRSWVLRKPPPTKICVKHLAISTNDHPLSWSRFSGEIKDGYGKGTVAIWDNGSMSWESTTGQLIFILYGKKLTGRYTLVPYQENFWFYKLY